MGPCEPPPKKKPDRVLISNRKQLGATGSHCSGSRSSPALGRGGAIGGPALNRKSDLHHAISATSDTLGAQRAETVRALAHSANTYLDRSNQTSRMKPRLNHQRIKTSVNPKPEKGSVREGMQGWVKRTWEPRCARPGERGAGHILLG